MKFNPATAFGVILMTMAWVPPTQACTMSSSSPEIELEINFEEYHLSRDRVEYEFELEVEVVSPSTPAQCQCAFGLGSTSTPLPPSFDVTSVVVGIRNGPSGSLDLPAFDGFARNPAIDNLALNLPGFTIGATPFGFSKDVDPFTLPPLQPGDTLFIDFQFEFDPDDYSLINGNQFQLMAGSNEPGHPLAFLAGTPPVLTLPQFVLNPYDFDGDDASDIDDLNLMLGVGPLANGVNTTPSTSQYDLDEDGVIDENDVNEWLEHASDYNGFSEYLVGDANLDGFVDGVDFILWNGNKFTSSLNWDDGDFNLDGVVDGVDFLRWNANKFSASGNAVPEPTGVLALLTGLGATLILRRRER